MLGVSTAITAAPSSVNEAIGTIGDLLSFLQDQHTSQRSIIVRLELELQEARANIERLQEGSSAALESSQDELRHLKDDIASFFKKFGDRYAF